jgi:hypothetical protein
MYRLTEVFQEKYRISIIHRWISGEAAECAGESG